MPKRTQGEYRKDFYQFFEKVVGREITVEEHDEPKDLMRGYLADHQALLPPPPPPPVIVKYKFTCKKCQDVLEGQVEISNMM